MAYLVKAEYLTDDQIVADILAIPKIGFKPNPNTGRIWAPIGVTWHNTGNPGLGLWNGYPEATKSEWGDNLNRYYKSMGWHSGPHACGTPSGYAIKLCDWLADGIHATCYNEDHFGVETVLNAATGGDDPTTGAGLAAMKSTANIIAALCIRFGWQPLTAVNFHRECSADHHSCPGNLVSNEFALGLVDARIAEIRSEASLASMMVHVTISAPSMPPLFSIPAWPPASNPMWTRAAQIVNALRAKGAENPFIVGALANGYAESAVTPKVIGDNDQAFSIWQWHFNPRGERILKETGIDVRSETSISKIVDALWWELENVYPNTFAKLKAAKTAEDAARIFCTEFEGAGAPNAMDRRASEASYLSVWVAQNEAFIVANPAP